MIETFERLIKSCATFDLLFSPLGKLAEKGYIFFLEYSMCN